MSCFGSKFLLAKPAGCKVAGCAHPHPFATGSSADDRTGLADERASSGKFSIVSPIHAAASPPILVDGGRLT